MNGEPDEIVAVLVRVTLGQGLLQAIGDDDDLVVFAQLPPYLLGVASRLHPFLGHGEETLIGQLSEVQMLPGVSQPDWHRDGAAFGEELRQLHQDGSLARAHASNHQMRPADVAAPYVFHDHSAQLVAAHDGADIPCGRLNESPQARLTAWRPPGMRARGARASPPVAGGGGAGAPLPAAPDVNRRRARRAGDRLPPANPKSAPQQVLQGPGTPLPRQYSAPCCPD